MCVVITNDRGVQQASIRRALRRGPSDYIYFWQMGAMAWDPDFLTPRPSPPRTPPYDAPKSASIETRCGGGGGGGGCLSLPLARPLAATILYGFQMEWNTTTATMTTKIIYYCALTVTRRLRASLFHRTPTDTCITDALIYVYMMHPLARAHVPTVK
jgi:hypothetical protein